MSSSKHRIRASIKPSEILATEPSFHQELYLIDCVSNRVCVAALNDSHALVVEEVRSRRIVGPRLTVAVFQCGRL
ncbi:MAG: hypothetical protein ACYDCC_15830 [Actinomycetota bacterium]